MSYEWNSSLERPVSKKSDLQRFKMLEISFREVCTVIKTVVYRQLGKLNMHASNGRPTYRTFIPRVLERKIRILVDPIRYKRRNISDQIVYNINVISNLKLNLQAYLDTIRVNASSVILSVLVSTIADIVGI